MDKDLLISYVRNNKILLTIYKYVINAFLYFLKIFISVDDKKVLFVSYGGTKYNDSPKALYEYMINDEYFKDYTFVWAFRNIEANKRINCKLIKIDTIKYYIEALSSKIWITNTSVIRGGLSLKRDETIEVNTWHGSPLKKLGIDANNDLILNKNKFGKMLICCQSEYDKKIFMNLFDVKESCMIMSDLPRNDSLFKYTNEEVLKIKDSLSIPYDKKVILYAPTYRDYERDALSKCYLKPKINFRKWEQELGENYVVLFRAHNEVKKIIGVNSKLVINVSDYEEINDLFIISDMLISDYSSIYFDYSILCRPMFNYSYDIDKYEKIRGLYVDLNSFLPCKINRNESDLLNDIVLYSNTNKAEIEKFHLKYTPNAGNATVKVIEKLKKILENKE